MNLPENIKRKFSDCRRSRIHHRCRRKCFCRKACATPRTLIAAMENSSKNLPDLQIFHFLTDGAIPIKERKATTRYKHRTFFL